MSLHFARITFFKNDYQLLNVFQQKLSSEMTEFTYYHRYFCLRIVTVEKKSKTVYPEEDEQDSDDENDAQIKSDKAVITNTTNGKLLSDIIPQIWKDFNNIM